MTSTIGSELCWDGTTLWDNAFTRALVDALGCSGDLGGCKPTFSHHCDCNQAVVPDITTAPWYCVDDPDS